MLHLIELPGFLGLDEVYFRLGGKVIAEAHAHGVSDYDGNGVEEDLASMHSCGETAEDDDQSVC